MPIYEYNCVSCGKNFEVLHRTLDEHVNCPACNGTEVERLLSTFSARVAHKMPACEGSLPRCSQARCRSGQCRLSED